MKIYAVSKICTDECTYHYETPLKHFLKKDRAEFYYLELLDSKDEFGYPYEEERLVIKEIEVE